MPAYLIVRAEVAETDREAFDHWYETEHLPDAHRAFNALNARRGWSALDPSHHLAFYEFPDLAAANAIADSNAIKELVAEFDRCWDDRVKRSREVVEISQSL
jgi:hypothetical protein